MWNSHKSLSIGMNQPHNTHCWLSREIWFLDRNFGTNPTNDKAQESDPTHVHRGSDHFPGWVRNGFLARRGRAPAAPTNWRNMLTMSGVIEVSGVYASTCTGTINLFWIAPPCTAVKLSNTTVHCREGMYAWSCKASVEMGKPPF